MRIFSIKYQLVMACTGGRARVLPGPVKVNAFPAAQHGHAGHEGIGSKEAADSSRPLVASG